MFERRKTVTDRSYLKAFFQSMLELNQKSKAKSSNKEQENSDGFRMISGYKVKEIFAGEESLTSLLTQYVERTIALQY